MSVGYRLANLSKKEIISFFHLPVSSKAEISQSKPATAIVTLYLLENAGDTISFFPDQYTEEDWKLSVSAQELMSYSDVTDFYLDKAEQMGLLSGRRKVVIDDDDPGLFYWQFDELSDDQSRRRTWFAFASAMISEVGSVLATMRSSLRRS